MTDLTSAEKSLVWTLREASEAASHTRARFLTIVSDELDKLEFDPPRRPLVFDFARAQADSSAKLASDTVAEGRVEDARRLLRDAAARVAAASWRATVRDNWPAPIAHEIERLFDEMAGRRLPAGERIDPSADSALLQLKDAFEVLIKFTATVLMRALIETGRDGGDGGDWARRQLFRRGLSLGHWAAMLRQAASRCTADGSAVPAPLANLARASQRNLIDAADKFVTVRNNVIGHGSRALDPFETATVVVGCLETGTVRNLRGEVVRMTPLATVLDTMVRDGAYEGLSLVAGEGDARIGLDGAGAMENWLADERHAGHQGTVIPTSLRLPGGNVLSLAPFVAARICSQCGHRNIFLYDSLHDATRGGRFNLVDYARGHKSRLLAAEAPDLSDALGDVVPEDAPEDAPELAGASINSGRVLEALDKARVDRNYLLPAYLRDDLAEFLRTRDRGVFWLQAPAHVGKTTFVQGLAEKEVNDTVIDPRFTSGAKERLVFAYYCRKEYRTGLPGMVYTLQDKLQFAYDVSPNLRNEQPQARPVVEAGTPEAFLKWLSDWKAFAERHKLAAAGAPLLVAIDGLDEADPPPGSTPLQVLPRPGLLPDGIYLVLTSRPIGDPDAPGFLATHVEALYGQP